MHTICPFLRKKSGVSVADLENYMLLLSSFRYKYKSFQNEKQNENEEETL